MDTQSNVKKMILVDQNSSERMRSGPTRALNQATALDSEMQKVIEKPNLSDHDRWAAYNELLQRYLGLKHEARKPVSIPIVDDSTPNVAASTDAVFNQVVTAVPKTHAKKAELLYNLLKRHPEHITWNDAGECTINGLYLRGPNITYLISDVIRSRKSFQPSYFSNFSKALALVNAPQDLVGNRERWGLVVKARLANSARLRNDANGSSTIGSFTNEDEGAVGFASSTPR